MNGKKSLLRISNENNDVYGEKNLFKILFTKQAMAGGWL